MNIWAWLTAAIIGNIVSRILLALGFSFVTFEGASYLLSLVMHQVIQFISGFPADVLNILGILRLDLAINLIFAAWTARITIIGFKTLRLV